MPLGIFTGMLKNYLKVALRNLWESKGFSAINIVGLAIGLAVFLLIALYVTDEVGFDKQYPDAARTYRVDADIYFNNTQADFAVAPDPMGAALKRDYPFVEEAVRMRFNNDLLVKKGDQNMQDHNMALVDSNFFRVFPQHMIRGNMASALRNEEDLAIDETTAKKYFGNADVIGKMLKINTDFLGRVSAVFSDMSAASHFHFHFIRKQKDWNNFWTSNNTYTYVMVRPGVSKQKLQGAVNSVVTRYLGEQLQQQLNSSLKDMESKGNHFRYPLMPLTDIHLHSGKAYELEANGNINYIYIFFAIAIIILLIACINFMNLSTARSANRAKEVGIRKVAGSLKSQLITQFLTESILVSLFALCLAVGIALLLIPLFNQLSGKSMSLASFLSMRWIAGLVGLVIVVGCLAGSYPALYLSSFNPAVVLKGTKSAGFRGSWLRSSLVVFQFTISIALIVGTIVIYKQLNFIRTRDIGFDRSQVLVVNNAYYLGEQIKPFRAEISGVAGVKNITVSGDVPTATNFDNNGWFRDANFDASRVVLFTNLSVDENYIPTMGMQIVAGRNFSKSFPTDSSGLLINESTARLLGFKNALNQQLFRPNPTADGKFVPVAYHVIGVVKDFNYSSMHDPVKPLVIQLGDNRGRIAIKVDERQAIAVIAAAEKNWKAMAPGQPFSYSFMNADFENIYRAEQQTGTLFISFAIFAIFIGCLGLFGLVTYAAEQRTKEIGVRKVLGASVAGIVTMISKDFTKLMIVAGIIAFPLAGWAMSRWLESFAYRASIGWEPFVIAGLTAFLIALVTICVQAIKAALANPVRSLRSE